MRRGLLSAMLAVAAIVEVSSGSPPGALARLGQQVGCRVAPEKPPGVVTLGIADRDAGTAYAAWCARTERGQALHDLLVSPASKEHAWAACPPHIRLGLPEPFPRLRPAILPRDLPYPMTLGDFWFLGEDYLVPGRRVGGAGAPRGPALDIGTGDAGNLLMCFDGRWIKGGYH